MSRYIIPILISSFVSIMTLFAQTDDELHETIVVSATALEENPEDVPASVTVIEREEIVRRHALDAGELLRSTPGVVLARSGSLGKQASLFLRGSNSTHTLVLWNGVEINDPYFSGYDWGRFSTAGIDRIEIVRGPYSALWGADAVGGVINIVTDDHADETHIDLSAGEHGFFNVAGGFGLDGENWLIELIGEQREDDGFHPNDDFEQTAVTATARYRASDSLSIGLSGRLNDYELGIPFSLGAPSPERRQSGEESQLILPVRWTSGSFDVELNASRVEHDLHFEDPDGLFGPELSDTRSLTHRTSLIISKPTAIGTIVAGAEREDSEVDDISFGFTNLDGRERESTGLFVENRLSRDTSVGRVDLMAGIRWDDYEQFGEETSPRVALALTRGMIRFGAAWGEAYRAPSVGDLYYPFFGNPDLQPETSAGIELSVERRFESGRLGAAWFDNDFENLIVFSFEAGRADNIGSASAQGFEIFGEWRSAAFRAGFNATFLDTLDRGTGTSLVRRPDESGSIMIGWERAAFDTHVTVDYTGSRLDIDPSSFTRVTNDGFIVSDLAATWRYSDTVQPYLRITNLFDENYQEVLGQPAPGRRASVGVRYSR